MIKDQKCFNDVTEIEYVIKKIAKSECKWLLPDLLPAAATSATTVGLRVLVGLSRLAEVILAMDVNGVQNE